MIALWAGFKPYIIAGATVILLAGVVWFGSHERAVGAAKVQAKWDIANAAQDAMAAKMTASARATESNQVAAFSGIESNYLQATSHAETPFDLAGAIAAGSLRLRNDCPEVPSRAMPHTTARSSGADDTPAAAVANRVQAAVDVVHTGGAADTRETQLREQVIALQAILRSEREQKK